MAVGVEAARWYESNSLSTNEGWTVTDGPDKKGLLKIIKKIVDENGDPLPVNEDTVYSFEVTTGMLNEDGEVYNTDMGWSDPNLEVCSITIGAGETEGFRELEPVSWEGNEAPEFVVKEFSGGTAVIEGYEYVRTEYIPATGEYKEDDMTTTENEGIVEIIVINHYKKNSTASVKNSKIN